MESINDFSYEKTMDQDLDTLKKENKFIILCDVYVTMKIVRKAFDLTLNWTKFENDEEQDLKHLIFSKENQETFIAMGKIKHKDQVVLAIADNTQAFIKWFISLDPRAMYDHALEFVMRDFLILSSDETKNIVYSFKWATRNDQFRTIQSNNDRLIKKSKIYVKKFAKNGRFLSTLEKLKKELYLCQYTDIVYSIELKFLQMTSNEHIAKQLDMCRKWGQDELVQIVKKGDVLEM